MMTAMTSESGEAFSSVFRPVHSATAFEETMERILRAIALGIVKQGERLPGERELCALLRVGRATLREALDALREVGIVESRRGRTGGSFVARVPLLADLVDPSVQVTPELVEDVCAFRGVVEVGAAEMAARRELAVAEIAALEQALATSLAAPIAEYRAADSRLHLAVAEATGSQHLVATVAEAELELHKLLDATPVIASKLRHSNVQHQAIVAAVIASKSETARRAMEDHLDATAALVRGFYGCEEPTWVKRAQRAARKQADAGGSSSAGRRRSPAANAPKRQETTIARRTS